MNHWIEVWYNDEGFHSFMLLQDDKLQVVGQSVRKFKRLDKGVEYTLW